MAIKKVQIGKLLLEQKLITQEQLDSAIIQQSITGRKLGFVLIDLGIIQEKVLLELLSTQLEVPYVDLRSYSLDPATVQKLPEGVARRIQCIVLEQNDDSYLVGMVDPSDILALDELVDVLKKPIRVALVSEAELLKVDDIIYRHSAEISNLAEVLSVEMGKSDYDISRLAEGLSMTDAPVAKLLQTIFEDAVQVNASDVHIEPDEHVLRIRQRIDGSLQEHIIKEKNVADALTLRLKLMAGINIAEKRIPQDGRFSITIRDKNFDVRLSTMPAQFGESTVMRLLNQSAALLNLAQIGMPAHMLEQIRKIIALPHGLFLITGPTGSGKTTTLYGMLNELNAADVKIITVEDPVEYRLPRITQVQVQPKIDLDFARVLRAVLRQDPDIIMIGELRDQETAEIAIRAAMTGHFVFATLHTNDAMSSAERLIDMGAEGYLVASVLRAVLAQRLVRRICQNCIQNYTLTPQDEAWLSGIAGYTFKDKTFKHGVGCNYCNQLGYRGQSGVYELLVINSDLAGALRKNNSEEFIRLVTHDPHFQSLLMNGLSLAEQGLTTLSEVLRISGDSLAAEGSNKSKPSKEIA